MNLHEVTLHTGRQKSYRWQKTKFLCSSCKCQCASSWYLLPRTSLTSQFAYKCSSVTDILKICLNIFKFSKTVHVVHKTSEYHVVTYVDLSVAHGKLLCSMYTIHLDCGCCILKFYMPCQIVITVLISFSLFLKQFIAEYFYMSSYAALQSAMSRIMFLWLRCLIFCVIIACLFVFVCLFPTSP
jgi:hypothetical protein